MGKGRWLILGIFIIGLFTVGGKRLKPLWHQLTKDPAVGLFVLLLTLLLVIAVARIVRS